MENSARDQGTALGRRRVLKAGGFAMVGAAGMTVASASAAHAAPGDNVVLGQLNSSDAVGTQLRAASTDPTLSIDNLGTGGDLRLPPGDVDAWVPTVGVAKGAEAGPFIAIDPDGNGVQKAYLVTSWDLRDFATYLPLLYPITPSRALDTRSASSRAGVLASSRTSPFDGSGRLLGNGWIDVSVAAMASGLDAIAVYVTLTALGATGAGYGKVWAAGTDIPVATNINYQASQGISNLAIAEVGSAKDQPAIRLWLSTTAHLVVDVSAVYGSLSAGSAEISVAGQPSPQSLDDSASTKLRTPVRITRDQLTR